MSEEENKAIKELIAYVKENRFRYFGCICGKIDIALNLIDRLQKELKQEKDLNEELQIRYNIEHDKYLKIKQELEQEKEKNKKLEGQNENLMQTIKEILKK